MLQKIYKVEIVTPVHNRRELTLNCLKSLKELNWKNISHHVIVVDDGSSDGTSEAIRLEFPEVQLVLGDGTLWYTGGMNAGINAALYHNPDYILAINDDTTFDKDCLQELVRCAENHPNSIVGALLCCIDDPLRVLQVAPQWDTWYGGWHHSRTLTRDALPKVPFEVKSIVGNCVLYPVRAIKMVGLMDMKTFPHAYSDIDYSAKMHKEGFRLIIQPKALVYCFPNVLFPPLKTLSLSKLIDTLIHDRHKNENVVMQFHSRLRTAPSITIGLASFAIYIVRMTLKALSLGGSWPCRPDPKPGVERTDAKSAE